MKLRTKLVLTLVAVLVILEIGISSVVVIKTNRDAEEEIARIRETEMSKVRAH